LRERKIRPRKNYLGIINKKINLNAPQLNQLLSNPVLAIFISLITAFWRFFMARLHWAHWTHWNYAAHRNGADGAACFNSMLG